MNPKRGIHCDGLRKRFGPVTAIDEVTLDVPAGESLALLGPSGCGKTTLLRLIAGFERPDAGSVTIRGRTVVAPGLWIPPDQRRVGFVFQDYALFPHMSVAANVGFGLSDRSTRKARVAEMLELVGLAHHAANMPHRLSGGEQQRVAVARALAPAPDVVLLDEPFSNLDAALRTKVRGELVEILSKAGATSVFVTHDHEEALSVGSRIAVMERGKVVEVSTPRDIYLNPQTPTAARSVGPASMLRGRAEGGVAICDLGRLPLGRPCTMGDVEILIRPESIRLSPIAHGAELPSENGSAPHGEVVDLKFHGTFQAVAVRLKEGQILRARIGPGSRLSLGDRVAIEITDPVIAYPVGTNGGADGGANGDADGEANIGDKDPNSE